MFIKRIFPEPNQTKNGTLVPTTYEEDYETAKRDLEYAFADKIISLEDTDRELDEFIWSQLASPEANKWAMDYRLHADSFINIIQNRGDILRFQAIARYGYTSIMSILNKSEIGDILRQYATQIYHHVLCNEYDRYIEEKA
jgi:hypothetical protein